MSAGITKKKKWQIFSLFGRMVFGAQKLIGKAQYSSKLEAIGCIEMPEFATAGCSKLDYLIYNPEIKEILVSPQHNNNIYFVTEKVNAYTNEPQRQQNPQICNSTHESRQNVKRSRSQTTHHPNLPYSTWIYTSEN
jgi:hypothetical protein